MRITVGIDEAGRGPLAGPVAVGAVAVVDSMRARKAVAKAFPKVKDSKQLSEKAREVWFAEIKKLGAEGYISWTVSFSSAKIIDDKDIEKIQEDVKQLIDNAVKFAEESPEPDVTEVMGWVYA